MSLSQGLVISEYRHYDYEKSCIYSTHADTVSINSIMSQYESLPPPPSYSAVLAEKQQCATWDERASGTHIHPLSEQNNKHLQMQLNEMNIMLNSLRQTINDTRTIIQTFQYCCIKYIQKCQNSPIPVPLIDFILIDLNIRIAYC